MSKKAYGKIAEGLTEALSISRSEIEPPAATLGRLGGNARAKKLSPERRSELAKKAAQSRWSKEPK